MDQRDVDFEVLMADTREGKGQHSPRFLWVCAVEEKGTISEKVDISALDGLLFWHVIEGKQTAVVSYWRSRDDFEACATIFSQRLGVEIETLFAGYVSRPQFKRQPIWKRYSLSSVVLATAAVLTALTVIRDHFAEFLAAPDVSLIVAQDPDVVRGSRISESLTIVNANQFGSAKVVFREAGLTSQQTKDKVLMKFESSQIPRLGPGTKETIKIFGDAPQLDAMPKEPQSYNFSVTVSGSGGMFRNAQDFHSEDRPIRVWYELANTQPAVPEHGHGYCIGEGKVFAGRMYATGVRGQVVLSESGLDSENTIINIEMLGSTIPISATGRISGPETVKIEFRTPELKQFQEYRYRVLIRNRTGEPLTDAACTQLVKDLNATFLQ